MIIFFLKKLRKLFKSIGKLENKVIDKLILIEKKIITNQGIFSLIVIISQIFVLNLNKKIIIQKNLQLLFAFILIQKKLRF